MLRRGLVTVLITVVALAGAAVALAAHPVKGATYKGTFRGDTSPDITFKVAKNGKKVSGFSIPSPRADCQGGGFGSAKGGSGKISKKGTFTVTLRLVSPLPTVPGHTAGKVVVTGKFQAHGKEKGTVKTIFTATAVFHASCDSKVSYTATG